MNRVARFKWLAAALISLLILTVTPLAAQGPTPDKDSGASKIAPTVRAALAKTGQADVLVVLSQQPDLSGADALTTRAEKARFVYERLRQTAAATQPAVIAAIERQGVKARGFGLLNAVHATGDARLVESLARRPDVARLESNNAVKGVQSTPDAPPAQGGPGTPWGINKVKAPEVWEQFTRGQGIVVGVADTGVEWTHPALQPKYRGWNGGAVDHSYNWHDAIRGETTPLDDYGHGTHVTGTVIGDEGANHIGVAPDARWIGCRNMDNGVGTPARYLDCMEFFLAPFPPGGTFLNAGRPDLGADVINNSWSCPTEEGCYPHTLTQSVAALRAAGIAFVGSAGNNGSTCGSVNEPPAITDETFSVGAFGENGAIAGFSSRGPVTIDGSNRPKPDLAAPGVNIISARRGGGYTPNQGTSMASPHVAGVVALVWAAVPALKGQIEATEAILRQTATQRNDTQCGVVADGRANYVWGWGEVNALAAIELARTSGEIAGQVRNGLALPINGAQVTLTGSGALSLTLRVDQTGQYRARLAPGVYSLTVSAFGYQSNTVNVTLDAIGAATQNVTLTPESEVVVTGIVQQAGLNTPTRATVEVVGANRRAATDANGYYALSLPPGSYTLRAAAIGYRPSEQAVTLTEPQTRDFNLLLAPNILIVDDDEGQSIENIYKPALNSLGRSYDIYEVRQTGLGPPATLLEQYCLVIWIVGGPLHRLRAIDSAALATYLDHGGRLLLSEPGGATSTFHSQYLRVAPGSGSTASTLVGLGPFDGQTLSYSGAEQTDAAGAVVAAGGGQAIYGWEGQGTVGGVAYNGAYRTVYLSFGLQNIAQVGRQAFLAGLLNWLGCPTCRLPADVDYSSRVDVRDIALVTTAWGATAGTSRYQTRLDRNLDGVIDHVDVDVITRSWLARCPTSP